MLTASLFAVLLLAMMVSFSSQVTGDTSQGGATMIREECRDENIEFVEVPHKDGQPSSGWSKYQFGDHCAGWGGTGRVQCVLTTVLSLPWDWGFSQYHGELDHGPAWSIGLTFVTVDDAEDLPLGISKDDIAINGDAKHIGVMITFCGDGDEGDWGVQDVRIYSAIVINNCVFLHSTYKSFAQEASYDRLLQKEM
jgi:hypothetical protein